MNKCLVIILVCFAALCSSHALTAQTVQFKLRNNHIFPKSVLLLKIAPDGQKETSYYGGWFPFRRKTIELQVGARLEYLKKDKVPTAMSGDFSTLSGRLLLEVKAGDAGKTVNLW